MKDHDNLSNLHNTHHMDENFSHFGGGHHGGGGHGGHGGYNPRNILYPAAFAYPVTQAIIYPTPTRTIQITPSGLKFLKAKKNEAFQAFKEENFLRQISNGKWISEYQLKQLLGYTDFDTILNWLASKNFITVI